MAINSYLDRDAYLNAQKIIQDIDQTLSNTYTGLGSRDFDILRNEHDYYGDLSKAMTEFVVAKRRIGNLYAAMTDYLAAWDEAQANANQNAGSVQVVTDRYSDQVFWNLYTDRVLEKNVGYGNSKAWQFIDKGRSFKEDYSDFWNFRWKSGLWPEGALWARDISSWRKNTVKGLNGDLYYDPLLEASLETMLKSLPGYAELDTVNTDIIDWDEIGKKIGVPGLKEFVEKLSSLAGDAGETMKTEDFQDVIEGLYGIADQWADNPGASKAMEAIAKALDSIDGKTLEGLGKGMDRVIKVQEISEFVLQMVLHCASDHTRQVEYLKDTADALLAAGYDENGIVSNLRYLQRLYSDDRQYVTQKFYDKCMEWGVGVADKAIGKLEVVKWVDATYGGIGTIAKIAASDKMKAADSLMGIMQYEGALTESFENYAAMIRSGVATEEDIQRADQVFEMLCTSKITGYENMKTIIRDKQHPAYIMAQTKIDELKEMMTGSAAEAVK